MGKRVRATSLPEAGWMGRVRRLACANQEDRELAARPVTRRGRLAPLAGIIRYGFLDTSELDFGGLADVG